MHSTNGDIMAMNPTLSRTWAFRIVHGLQCRNAIQALHSFLYGPNTIPDAVPFFTFEVSSHDLYSDLHFYYYIGFANNSYACFLDDQYCCRKHEVHDEARHLRTRNSPVEK